MCVCDVPALLVSICSDCHAIKPGSLALRSECPGGGTTLSLRCSVCVSYCLLCVRVCVCVRVLEEVKAWVSVLRLACVCFYLHQTLFYFILFIYLLPTLQWVCV